MKDKALNLMQSICVTHELNHLNDEEIEKTLWKLFELKSKEIGLDVATEQLKEWIEEDKLKEYFILEDKDNAIDSVALFKKSHGDVGGLKIISTKMSSSNLEDVLKEIPLKVKINNFK